MIKTKNVSDQIIKESRMEKYVLIASLNTNDNCEVFAFSDDLEALKKAKELILKMEYGYFEEMNNRVSTEALLEDLGNLNFEISWQTTDDYLPEIGSIMIFSIKAFIKFLGKRILFVLLNSKILKLKNIDYKLTYI